MKMNHVKEVGAVGTGITSTTTGATIASAVSSDIKEIPIVVVAKSVAAAGVILGGIVS